MPETSSKIRTMKKDIARFEGVVFDMDTDSDIEEERENQEEQEWELENYPERNLKTLDNEELEQVKVYKSQAIKEKEELLDLLKRAKNEIEKINIQLSNLESSSNDRDYRKKRRNLFKEKRKIEEAQIKINKKIEEVVQDIEKLTQFEKSINSNNPSS